jgi:hypothetical protein
MIHAHQPRYQSAICSLTRTTRVATTGPLSSLAIPGCREIFADSAQ